MNIFSFISNIFNPVTKLIDEIHVSEEEKMQVKAQILKTQNELYSKTLEYETKLIEAKSDVLKAEATGASWLQRNWRPITMLVFLVLIILDCFGLLTFRLAPQAWTLLQIGLGGYVVGRSAEKTLPKVIDFINKNKKE